jgi:hypothetical protein
MYQSPRLGERFKIFALLLVVGRGKSYFGRVKNGKHHASERKPDKAKSRGTVWAVGTRAQCNTLTPPERQKLMERALQIAYGSETQPSDAHRD